MAGRRLAFGLGLAALVAALAACGGGGDGSRPSDADNAGDGARAQAASTPGVEPTQPGPPQIRTSLSGSCRLTATGAEIRVEYAVAAFGSAMLKRVKLLEDGREVEDSGPLEQRQFRKVAVLQVEPGERHTYRVAAESAGASAANVQSTVLCGVTATATPAPRASR